ncbi:MAG: menaquinone biosynthesis protein [Deltaproteobacteria bacterium]|nr:menaquinone biosynthesis protein [Deltaproteobacteria bacterium]
MNRIKLGHIKYINSYPIFYTILKERKNLTFDLVSDIPTRLNALMRKGDLDVSLISSYEYVTAPENYLIHKDFCLASTGYVNSVLLISKKDVENLDGAKIGLTTSSATSINLLKIILREFYGFSNEFNRVPFNDDFEVSLKTNDAVLIIGDEALKFIDNGTYKVYDIGNLWTERTGYPVVFAIIAINTQSAKTYKNELAAVFEKFNESYDIFKARPEEIADFARLNSTLSINFMEYFHNLKYNFTNEFKEGLNYYFRMLYKCGLIQKAENLRFY